MGVHDPDLAAEKAALRRRLRAARRALAAQVTGPASAAIAARLTALPELAGARRVLAYAAVPGEPDLGAWLDGCRAGGAATYLPWVDGEDLRIARVTHPERELVPGWRGLREPHHAGGDRGEDPAELDAAVVPGVAFDPRGGRLGQGGGHLDRLLSRLRPDAVVVGVAFDIALVDRVPREPHDVGVGVVVSDRRVWRRD